MTTSASATTVPVVSTTSSMDITSVGLTVDRDDKIQNLKNKIIWVCCANRLSPPLQYVGKVLLWSILE
jgi:hypothetical protein